MRARDQLRGCEAGPADEHQKDDEREDLDGGGNTESTELRAIMDKQVAIPEECGCRAQSLRHKSPLQSSNVTRNARVAPDSIQKQELPSPSAKHPGLPNPC